MVRLFHRFTTMIRRQLNLSHSSCRLPMSYCPPARRRCVTALSPDSDAAGNVVAIGTVTVND